MEQEWIFLPQGRAGVAWSMEHIVRVYSALEKLYGGDNLTEVISGEKIGWNFAGREAGRVEVSRFGGMEEGMEDILSWRYYAPGEQPKLPVMFS